MHERLRLHRQSALCLPIVELGLGGEHLSDRQQLPRRRGLRTRWFCSPSLLGSRIGCQCQSETFCQADSGSTCSETGADGVTTSVPCSCGGNCGHGYFCHKPEDACLSDSDCAARATCNFDLTSQSWMCTGHICPF